MSSPLDPLLTQVFKTYLSTVILHKLALLVSAFDFEFLSITFHSSIGLPTVPTLSCIDLSEDVSGVMNVTVSWTLSSSKDNVDFYLINITTNAFLMPYDELLNITIANLTQYELTGFIVGQEYNITIRGVNCGSQKGDESETLTINPQGKSTWSTA